MNNQMMLQPDRYQMLNVVKRMRVMLPDAKNAPDEYIWRVAQLAMVHELDPFDGDIYLYEKDGEWICGVGISGWKRAANRQSKYTCKFEILTDDEIKRLRGDNYDSGDRGYLCQLWRFDNARECNEINIPYHPVEANGLYRINASRADDGTWTSDKLPNCQEPEDIAKRRAEIAAIRAAYVLDVPEQEISAAQIVEQTEQWHKDHRMTTALPIQKKLHYEDDGGIFYAPG